MSEENVELVREFIEGFNRGGIEAVIDQLTPDWVGHPFQGWVGDPIYHGREGMRKLAAAWTENFDDYRWDIKELIDAGGDSVLALVEHGGTAKHADLPIGERMAAIVGPVVDGMITQTSFFLSWDEGARAAGLSE